MVLTIGYNIGRRIFVPMVKTIGYNIGRRYATCSCVLLIKITQT
jgi:hypothetical protein